MFNEKLITKNILTTLNNSTSGATIHVAVSGGADSMSLLYLASKIVDTNVFIHHVKHNVSKNTKEWSDFVKNFASILGFNTDTQYIEHDLHFDSMQNFESEARKKRYEAIFSYMNSGDILLLGHHADDQVENVLINLFKGRGINGLTSLQEKNIHSNGVVLYRPLIHTNKEDIIAYLNNQEISFIHDESNDSSDYDRNFIRNKVIPLLLERFKPLKRSILSVHKALTNSRIVMEELIDAKINDISENGEVDVTQFNSLSVETRTEITINLLRRAGCYTYNQKVLKEFISQAENIQKNGGVCEENNIFKTKIVIKSDSKTYTIMFKKNVVDNRKYKVFFITI
jgi:tRNA(Ile)-lysidine synthase